MNCRNWHTARISVANGFTDPSLIAATVARVRELIGHASVTTATGTRPLRASGRGRGGAARGPGGGCAGANGRSSRNADRKPPNALQGLERPAVVAVHPLAGKAHR